MTGGRVVITGAGGLIGGILRQGLADDWELVVTDQRSNKQEDIAQVDMTKLGAAERSFKGADFVVDLAANPSAEISWDEAYGNNIRATMNALEAARRTGVKRLVYASSNHVTGLYEQDEPYASIVRGEYGELDPARIPRITTRMPARPDGPYGVSKSFGETAGRYYAETFGLSVICLRIGTVNAESRPRNARELATLLTHGDLVRLVECSLRAGEDVRYGVFYGASANTWCFWDLSDAESAIGYRPGDNAESWR